MINNDPIPYVRAEVKLFSLDENGEPMESTYVKIVGNKVEHSFETGVYSATMTIRFLPDKDGKFIDISDSLNMRPE